MVKCVFGIKKKVVRLVCIQNYFTNKQRNYYAIYFSLKAFLKRRCSRYNNWNNASNYYYYDSFKHFFKSKAKYECKYTNLLDKHMKLHPWLELFFNNIHLNMIDNLQKYNYENNNYNAFFVIQKYALFWTAIVILHRELLGLRQIRILRNTNTQYSQTCRRKSLRTGVLMHYKCYEFGARKFLLIFLFS